MNCLRDTGKKDSQDESSFRGMIFKERTSQQLHYFNVSPSEKTEEHDDAVMSVASGSDVVFSLLNRVKGMNHIWLLSLFLTILKKKEGSLNRNVVYQVNVKGRKE